VLSYRTLEGGIEMEKKKPIKGKVILSGEIVCKTGLHIGASDTGLSIGGMDNPVIRDPLTKTPYIPGSSLKGKLRSLFERAKDMEFNKYGGNNIYRHECSNSECPVCRLFGASSGSGKNIPSRLQVRDAFLSEESLSKLSELDEGLPYTEWKAENSLDRITCAANRRPIERVPAGATFEFELVYTIEKDEDLKEDLNNLQAMLRLLEDDALGGGGSRGNGRVEIKIKDVLVRKIGHYIEGEDEIKVDLDGGDLGASVEKEYKG
jgi:CRISPR-associated protein Csm3